ncbi:MAG TPA: roadblock/LC7 domain-containing protein [Deltaproteobacteria bacterium]|nr:roadblock/LC7 domain-containing protein [Deltaproteobacteria bacterium]
MTQSSLVMFDEEYRELTGIVEKLVADANAKSAFLVDKDGQLITLGGETEGMDVTSLASLTAGNIAATDGLAKLVGEKEFSILFHEGEKDNIHLSLIAGKVILVVIFDERSSLGLVRLRVRKASRALEECIERVVKRARGSQSAESRLLDEITDEDIDKLFS